MKGSLEVTVIAFSFKGYSREFKKYVPKDSENSIFFRLAKYIKETVEKDPDFGELKSITISPCFDDIAEIKMEFV